MTRPADPEADAALHSRRHGHGLFHPLSEEGVVRETVRGGVVVLSGQAITFGLTMLTVAILARILTPSDYGVFALLLIVVNFLTVFSNAGLNEATLQSRHMTHEIASGMYWFNVTVGVAMAVVCAALAPLAAWFFHQPALTATLAVMGLSFPVAAFGAQHRALLQRSMRFRSVAICDVLAYAVGMVVATGCALAGAGYWSLVALQLSAVSTQAVALRIASRWRPGRPHWSDRVRALVSVGLNVTGFQIANYFGTNADNILVGRVLGVFDLGSYSRAYNLLIAPLVQVLTPVQNVLIVTLSRVGQANPHGFRQAYASFATKINLVLIPLTAFLVVNAHAVVRIALGPQWDQAATVFIVLGIGGLVEPTLTMVGWLLIAQERSRDFLVIGITRAPAMVIGFIIGVQFGVYGVAAGYSVVTCLSVVPVLWFAGRAGPVGGRAIAATCVLGGTAAAAVVVASLITRAATPGAGAVGSLLLAAGASAVVLAALIALIRPLRVEAGQVRRLLAGAFLG